MDRLNIKLSKSPWALVWLPQIAAGVFMLCNVIAMMVYGGGTLHNAESIGYSITHNYFSDLGRYISHSGQLNKISFWLFNGSVILCGLSFCMFFTSYNAFLQRYKT